VNTPGRSIVLIGFMGAGKSAVGRELAKRTKLLRQDTDELVRARFGSPIPEIFAQHGEEGFRNAETELLQKLGNKPAMVVVTGGGITLREENVRLLRSLGMTIWLDAEEEILWQRASRRGNRPLLQTTNPREKFNLLLRERRPLYQAAAERRIDTSNASIADVAIEITKIL
jgi:shikimate kinase